jgi:hypothetical protein
MDKMILLFHKCSDILLNNNKKTKKDEKRAKKERLWQLGNAPDSHNQSH